MSFDRNRYEKVSNRMWCENDLSHNEFIKRGCITSSAPYDVIVDSHETRVKIFSPKLDADGRAISYCDAAGNSVDAVCNICGSNVLRMCHIKYSGDMLKKIMQKYLPYRDRAVVKEFMSELVFYANCDLEMDFENIPGDLNSYGMLFTDYGIKVNKKWFCGY